MGTVFITVGTTRFDALTDQIAKPELCKQLSTVGKFSSIAIQYGCASKVPDVQELEKHFSEVTVFGYKGAREFKELMERADFVISHAGAGSIFESLYAGKRLLVVVNESLADNHQLELAQQLQNHLRYTTVSQLQSVLADPGFYDSLNSLEPLTNPSTTQFAQLVDEEMGCL